MLEACFLIYKYHNIFCFHCFQLTAMNGSGLFGEEKVTELN